MEQSKSQRTTRRIQDKSYTFKCTSYFCTKYFINYSDGFDIAIKIPFKDMTALFHIIMTETVYSSSNGAKKKNMSLRKM